MTEGLTLPAGSLFLRWYRALLSAPLRRKPADSPVYRPLAFPRKQPKLRRPTRGSS